MEAGCVARRLHHQYLQGYGVANRARTKDWRATRGECGIKESREGWLARVVRAKT
jgi:hypothetical protein